MKRWLALPVLAAFAGLFAVAALAQPEGVILVAKPGLADPNFRETVVLVTHAPDGSTLGVVLNRPSSMRLADLAPKWPRAERYQEPLFAGGPVMRQVAVALFVAETPPKASAFRVLPDIYLSMHPENIEALLDRSGARPDAKLRLFAGFAGWAPQQLEAEIDAGGWYVLRASDDLLFRKDTSGLWAELVEKARGARTQRPDAIATLVAAR